MRKIIALSLLGLSTISAPAVAQSAANMPPPVLFPSSSPQVDLSVSGSVKNKPDIAIFSSGVSTTAPTAKSAIKQNAIKMTAVIAKLKAMGISDKDIQTSDLSLNRDYDFSAGGKQRLKGYVVSNTVTGTLHDLTKLPDLLDAIASDGATDFSGPYFSLENDSAATNAARDKAWESAMALARYHAKKAGYSDIKIVRVSEGVGSGYGSMSEPAMMASIVADAAAAPSTPIQEGEITTTVTLSFTFDMVK